MALNRSETTVDGRHCSVLEDGTVVRDDVLTALDVMDALSDAETPGDFKVAYTVALMFPDAGGCVADGFARRLPQLCWELYGIDLTGEHASECGGSDVFDWQEDEDRIRASFLSAYGMTVPEAAEKCSYKDFCAMLGMLPPDTPMGRAVYYRVADEPESDGRNGAQVRAFRKMRRMYALKGRGGTDGYGAMSAEADAAFDALKGVRNG